MIEVKLKIETRRIDIHVDKALKCYFQTGVTRRSPCDNLDDLVNKIGKVEIFFCHGLGPDL